jgi:ABC-type branched-subunit amino acid transport system substrate-binding protein
MTFEGAKMAAEEVNRSGGVNGVPIELIPIDTREESAASTMIAPSRTKRVSLPLFSASMNRLR